jgi:hypothetical protein
MKVSLIDASHFDVNTAFAAVNTFRLDDLRPHIYRTSDGGKTWTHITTGIPDGGIINAVREDPKRRGLLYAGTEQAVYVSFDNGGRWQSLRLNMPATSIRDLVVKDDDLVVGTHGRSFWILDDITPLRQLSDLMSAPSASSAPSVLPPQLAIRVRWNMNTDTPLPPDEPAGQNPPDGAILHYWLPADAQEVTLEIADASGSVIRRYSSEDPPEPLVDGRNTPDYWIRPHQPLLKSRGLHRFVWDLHHERPAVTSFSYPIAAIRGNTPRTPLGSWVPPGRYTVRLTVNGQTRTAPLEVRMDPRVKASAAEIQQQYTMSRRLDGAIRRTATELVAARSRGEAGAARAQELQRLTGTLTQLFGVIESADLAPTTQAVAAVEEMLAAVERVLATR